MIIVKDQWPSKKAKFRSFLTALIYTYGFKFFIYSISLKLVSRIKVKRVGESTKRWMCFFDVSLKHLLHHVRKVSHRKLLSIARYSRCFHKASITFAVLRLYRSLRRNLQNPISYKSIAWESSFSIAQREAVNIYIVWLWK